MGTINEQAANLRRRWETDSRWAGIERTYSAEDVIRLRGPVTEDHTLARLGATRLWDLLHSQDAVRALGAVSHGQAIDEDLHAIYLPGWQAEADGHPAAHIDLGHSLHPAKVPAMVRRTNKALHRAAPVARSGQATEAPARQWLAPVVADAEAGPGDVRHAFELMTAMIEAGAAGVHFEDQLAAEHQGGRVGGKLLSPTGQHIKALNAARLAADVLDVPSIIIARTAATSATLLASDDDERDHEFLTGEQTEEGFHHVRPSLYACVTRGLAYAPYADLLWLEASTPDLAEARAFAQIIHSQYPDKMLAYSCMPTCDWDAHLDAEEITKFQKELAAMGYRFQFVNPAASPAPSQAASAYVPRQDTQHDEHGAYFDLVTQALALGAEAPAPDVELELGAEHFISYDQTDHHGRLVPAD